MYITHKIEIKPNKTTIKLFNQYFGYSRYLYNKMLAIWVKQYDKYKIFRNKEDKPNQYKIRDICRYSKKDWESFYAALMLDTVSEDVQSAFNMMWKGYSKYPKFKSKKKSKDTFRFYKKNDSAIKVNGKKLSLVKFPYPIKMTEELKYEGIVKSVTITKKANKYYASFVINVDIKIKPIENNKYCGIDLGVRKLAIINDSDNRSYYYKSIIKQLKPLYEKIDYYNKRLARKRNVNKDYKNSKKYQVMKTKLQRIYLRISNIQQNYLHQITSRIISRYQYITIETLKPSNMVKNHNLAKVISQSLFYTFRIQLEYKASIHGNTIIKADQWFPSSQICSHCGNVLTTDKKLKLKDKIYHCPKCKKVIDRDKNAAINLKLYGMRWVGLQP